MSGTGVLQIAGEVRETSRVGHEPGWIYRALGVEPVINCAGVRTQHGGSNPAPEVLAAMAAAAEAFVDLDELAEGVGRRLGELTGAEWGIVTSSTAAALSLATAACIAGNDPELMLCLPRTAGIPNRVIMLEGQRFDYDNAIRIAGGEIVTATNADQLAALLDDSAVMICLLARSNSVPGVGFSDIVAVAHERNVPILVDAAGLSPSKPDRWLREGADLVVYSGGKYLRAPQSTAILLGSERLCRAAWINGPPHQAFGRGMKVGKEEIVGAVAALDRWLNSDSARIDQASWLPRLHRIACLLDQKPGVKTELITASAFVTISRLRVTWDRSVYPIDSETLRRLLLEGRPRILIHDFWSKIDSITIDPLNIPDHDVEVVAETLVAIICRNDMRENASGKFTTLDLCGTWFITITFLHGNAEHRLELKQEGRRIEGKHFARNSVGEVHGRVHGDDFKIVAVHPKIPCSIYYSFDGTYSGGTLKGTVFLGASSDEHFGSVFQKQFGTGTWTTTRISPQTICGRLGLHS